MPVNYSIGIRIVIVTLVLLVASVQDTYAQKRAPVKSFRKLPIKKVVAHKKLIGVVKNEKGIVMQSVPVGILDSNKTIYTVLTDKDGCFEIGFPSDLPNYCYVRIAFPLYSFFSKKLNNDDFDSRLNISLNLEHHPLRPLVRNIQANIVLAPAFEIKLSGPPLRINANPIYDEADIQRAGSVEAILKDHPFLQRGR
jgi:hypothetical protein